MNHAKRFFVLQHATSRGTWVDYHYYLNLHNAEADCKVCTERNAVLAWRVIQRPIEEWSLR